MIKLFHERITQLQTRHSSMSRSCTICKAPRRRMPPQPAAAAAEIEFHRGGVGEKADCYTPSLSLQREAQLQRQRREEEDRGKKKGPLFPLARTTAAAFLAGLAEAEESHARTERGGRFQGLRP